MPGLGQHKKSLENPGGPESKKGLQEQHGQNERSQEPI